MAELSTPSAVAMFDAGAEKKKPEKPDEAAYNSKLAQAEKEHKEATAKFVSIIFLSITLLAPSHTNSRIYRSVFLGAYTNSNSYSKRSKPKSMMRSPPSQKIRRRIRDDRSSSPRSRKFERNRQLEKEAEPKSLTRSRNLTSN